MNRRHFLGAAFAVALPAPLLADDAKVAGLWFDRWLTAFNGDDPLAYAAFVRAHIPDLVPYIDDDLTLREASGGFRVLSFERAAGRLAAIVQDRHWDRRSRVVLEATDGRIEDLSFGPAAGSVADVERLSEAALLGGLAHKLDAEAAAGRFAATVRINRNGAPLFRRAYGIANEATGRRVTPETRFCIGSMGKMFTAVATLQLVSEARLSLADPLSRWLPDYPNAAIAAVTVEQLLTHSGGTGDIFGAVYDANAATLKTPDDFIRLYGARAPAFAPGSRYGYSNYGYVLLGALIERVSGRPWADHYARRIFAPAGMTATSATADGETAVPYVGAKASGRKALPFYVGLPAGGGYSTVDDLARFGAALRDGRLLTPAALALLTTPLVAAGDSHRSAGLRIGQRGHLAYYGHSGGAPGVNGDYSVYPDAGYEVIVLANRGHPTASNVAEFVGLRLPA